jgi:hypothetical protein
MIAGAAEKLAPEKQSLRQFQRKTPRRSHPPWLRQWGRGRSKNCVTVQRLYNAPGAKSLNGCYYRLRPNNVGMMLIASYAQDRGKYYGFRGYESWNYFQR